MFQNHPAQKWDSDELRIMVNEVFNGSATDEILAVCPRMGIPVDHSDKKNLI